ncbi:MAG: IS66 family transposase [Spirochaetaceae bacterium]|nr:IS66 family transposase [Spirochaetaceae bacterium]
MPKNTQKYIRSLESKSNRLESRNRILEKSKIHLERKVDQLQEKLRLALYRKFGRSSEKIDPNQQELFGEAEVEADVPEAEESTTTVSSHTRKKVGRKPLDPNIPRQEVIHDIPEEEKLCGCGARLSKVDEVVSEELEIIPEQVFVKRHIYPKYACRCCEGSGDEDKPVFRVAKAEPRLLPGSIASPALLAFILVNKFTDHLPFYRQENRFERIGAHISRQDMSNWTLKSYAVLKILEELFVKKIKEGPVLQMDETPVQVMKEPERPDIRKSYMWLARGGPPDAPLVYYKYHPTRDAGYIRDFLKCYSGFLQTDGYAAYDSALKDNELIIHVGCMAHLRRKFHEAAKGSRKAGGSHIALGKIQKIYRVEEELRGLEMDAAEFLARRKEQVVPLLVDFKTWLDEKALQVRPSSAFGQAISYASSQWTKVIRYLESPYLTPDNNAAERSIKPFIMGRKNWLFSGSPRGADASCFFYSMIET